MFRGPILGGIARRVEVVVPGSWHSEVVHILKG